MGLIDDKNAIKWMQIKKDIDTIYKTYSTRLEIIYEDNSDIDISHEAIQSNPQIAVLKQLTKKLDDVAEDVNSIAPYTFNKIVTKKETIQFPKTQELGTFHHTLVSVGNRLGKLDTWGVIIICFFFDLLGPFLFYFYLRKDDSDDYEPSSEKGWGTWWENLRNK